MYKFIESNSHFDNLCFILHNSNIEKNNKKPNERVAIIFIIFSKTEDIS
jgi:hypothetical protein